MISKIDVVHKKHWMIWDEEIIQTTTIIIGRRGYVYNPGLPQYIRKTYKKIYNPKFPEKVTIGNDGYFVQSASKFSFSIDADDWSKEYLLFQKGQVRKGYAQAIEIPEAWADVLDCKHPVTNKTIAEELNVKYRHWDINSQIFEWQGNTPQYNKDGSFADPCFAITVKTPVVDYFYNDVDIDVSDYICAVWDNHGKCIFSGFINADGVEYVVENDTIKIDCSSMMTILSKASEKNSMVYYTPKSDGVGVLYTNVVYLIKDVLRNANRMFAGRDPEYKIKRTVQITNPTTGEITTENVYQRTMTGFLIPSFSV